jgi:hypothetical protein
LKGENDIERFVGLAQANDLFVILRPGPFIDAGRLRRLSNTEKLKVG